MSKEIKKITLSSIFSGLTVALIIVGSLFELLDLTCAAFGALTVYISMLEIKGKYPFLIYLTASVLSLILIPLSTATLYYVAFFGYYPILRYRLRKLKKVFSKLICFGLFNFTMILLYLLFKAAFALQNEPYVMYLVLLITANVFFLCFDFALDVFAYIYIKKIRPKLKKHF